MTIFTRPQWCIEPLRPHGEPVVWQWRLRRLLLGDSEKVTRGNVARSGRAKQASRWDGLGQRMEKSELRREAPDVGRSRSRGSGRAASWARCRPGSTKRRRGGGAESL
jgi:hypothetical protein